MSQNIHLRIFVPDIKNETEKKVCVPLLHPFLCNKFSHEKRIERYGDWINHVQLVNELHDCDVVVPAYYVNYYYTNKMADKLKNINQQAGNASKITVCWTNGDWGVTPLLEKFHLYRNGGYLSRNRGNQFAYPFFLNSDPVDKFYNGILPVHSIRPEKPVIGFCGRASNDMYSRVIDRANNSRRFLLSKLGLWHEDIETFHSSSFKRFQMLEAIKKSNKVETNFICFRGFVGGLNSFKNSEEVNKAFYNNMKNSHYIFCYRGWGNFSLRLYETLAAGRIPVIVMSDNNLPFTDKIDWNIFPVATESQYSNIAEIVASFHARHTNAEFVDLQYRARKIWEQFFTYKSFMMQLVKKYTRQSMLK